MRVRQLLTTAALAAGSMLASAGVSRAVIVHPGEEFTVPALENVVGRWGTNASAVAIAPNWIISTRHQGGGFGTNVVFGGTTYVVDQEIIVPHGAGNADLRLARIETPGGADANLTAYTPLYTGSGDGSASVTIGGFGQGLGTTLTTTGGTYGYSWDGSGNTTLRFGNNLVEGSSANVAGIILGSVPVINDLIFGFFDGPSVSPSGEGMVTLFDSGGGWFINNAGTWQVAALSRGISHTGVNLDDPSTPLVNDPRPQAQALFASFQNANDEAPDYMDGVRLSSYRTFINAQVPEPATGLVLMAGGVLLALRRRRG